VAAAAASNNRNFSWRRKRHHQSAASYRHRHQHRQRISIYQRKCISIAALIGIMKISIMASINSAASSINGSSWHNVKKNREKK